MDASPGGVVIFVFLWATNYTHARRNHDAHTAVLHTLLLLLARHALHRDREHGQGGRDTHTYCC
ncbi:unnamed protein product [Ectocarpus sp. CCAP 1310/34]|nr:unnamed protein product [Ectocarpus sp. CCAP 1310/34]